MIDYWSVKKAAGWQNMFSADRGAFSILLLQTQQILLLQTQQILLQKGKHYIMLQFDTNTKGMEHHDHRAHQSGH